MQQQHRQQHQQQQQQRAVYSPLIQEAADWERISDNQVTSLVTKIYHQTQENEVYPVVQGKPRILAPPGFDRAMHTATATASATASAPATATASAPASAPKKQKTEDAFTRLEAEVDAFLAADFRAPASTTASARASAPASAPKGPKPASVPSSGASPKPQLLPPVAKFVQAVVEHMPSPSSADDPDARAEIPEAADTDVIPEDADADADAHADADPDVEPQQLLRVLLEDPAAPPTPKPPPTPPPQHLIAHPEDATSYGGQGGKGGEGGKGGKSGRTPGVPGPPGKPGTRRPRPRGGTRQPNTQWHSALAQAVARGSETEWLFRFNYPKPGEESLHADWKAYLDRWEIWPTTQDLGDESYQWFYPPAWRKKEYRFLNTWEEFAEVRDRRQRASTNSASSARSSALSASLGGLAFGRPSTISRQAVWAPGNIVYPSVPSSGASPKPASVPSSSRKGDNRGKGGNFKGYNSGKSGKSQGLSEGYWEDGQWWRYSSNWDYTRHKKHNKLINKIINKIIE